jgi:mono/diheme cytochrome c family protein
MRRLSTMAGFVLLLAPTIALAASQADHEDVARGRSDYLRLCASCHGVTGDGRGPVASVLRRPPADLRHLGERYGVPLQADRVAAFIDGRADVAAHGPRDMPVWGERFSDVQVDGKTAQEVARERIAALIAYLNSIQERDAR